MPWLSILTALFKLAGALARHLGDRQLLDAGAAQAVAEASTTALARIAAAQAAGAAVRDTPEDIEKDSANRDNWR